MNLPPNKTDLTELFELREGHAFAALSGRVSLEQAANAVMRALIAARDRGIKRLLVDARELTGFPSPSVADRYFIVQRWATEVGKQVELSLILEQHILDPDRFGMMVATNLGMRADAFNSPAEALAWLLSGQPSRVATMNQKLETSPTDAALKNSRASSNQSRSESNR